MRRPVAVFRSSALLDTDAEIKDGKLIMTGAVHDVDFARMAAADPYDWDVDPQGDPRAGAKVRLRITELIPVRTKVGTSYDFITKTTQPVYEAQRTHRRPRDAHGHDRRERRVPHDAGGHRRGPRVPGVGSLRGRGRADDPHRAYGHEADREPDDRWSPASVAPRRRGRRVLGRRSGRAHAGRWLPGPRRRPLPLHGGQPGAAAGSPPVRPQVLDRVPFRLDPECVRPGRPVQRTRL